MFGLHEGPKTFVENEVELYNVLSAGGIRVPEVLPTLKGENASSIRFNSDNYNSFLMRFEKLREISSETVTEEELRKIVNGIATIHRLLENFSLPNKYESENIDSQKDSEEKKEEEIQIDWSVKEIYPLLIKSPMKDRFTSAELEEIKILDKKANEIMSKSKDTSDLKKSVIHGDMGLTHARFLLNGEVYFFDFADRGYKPIVNELATFLLEFVNENFEKTKNIIIDEYQKTNPLSQKDLDALEGNMISRIIGTGMYLCYRSMAEKSDNYLDSIKNRIELLRKFL